MPTLDRLLEQIERLIASVKPNEAEERLRTLLSTIGDQELRVWEVDLRRTIDKFLPKRRRALTAALEERLTNASASKDEVPPLPQVDVELGRLGEDFADFLEELKELHIFQWSTFYRDGLSNFFNDFFAVAHQSDELADVCTTIRQAVEKHSRDIFRKGYYFVMRQSGDMHQYAITKSLHGLQRFLDLPVEFYSAKLPVSHEPASARILRALCSAMLRAILEGYAAVRFGSQSGAQVLPRYPRAWAHTLAFLEGSDVASVVGTLEPGDFRDGALTSVAPLAESLDELAMHATDYVPLPALAQLIWESRRLDVSLHPPPYSAEPQMIEVQCYLDTAFVDRRSLDEAAARNIGVVVAPLRPDLQTLVDANERLSRIVVPAAQDLNGAPRVTRRLVSALEYTIYRRRSPRMGAQPLQYNFSREFPLQNPFLTRYFHVYRSSVRELLRTFERRNGVRLWCSIRRSGKTTACLDLGSTTGQSTIISQTCDNTGQIPDGNVFYDAVCDALTDGQQLSKTFLMDVIARCSFDRGSADNRAVFVLDEYETLFGRIRATLRREPELRYTVIQPLLNQMVAFTRDNLLVFLGQQPNAHFILMDQNQLSPYVEQDSFPLFRHDEETTGGEFAELIRKVLTERVYFDLAFCNAVFSETAGHPYLTVNLLVEFVDWLIETKRPMASLTLDEADFAAFAAKKLRPRRISMSPEYTFFREAMAEALGTEGKAQTPWLYGIYTCLREICRASPESFACTRADFDSLVEQLKLPDLGLSADLLLDTGSQANFLKYDETHVRPKVQLLGRIAAISRRRVGA